MSSLGIPVRRFLFGFVSLIATLSYSVASSSVSDVVRAMQEKRDKMYEAQNIFGIGLFSKLSDVDPSFSCREIPEPDAFNFECRRGKEEILIQARGKNNQNIIYGMTGIQEVTLEKASSEFNRITNLIGFPDTTYHGGKSKDGTLVPSFHVWGEGSYVEPDERPSRYFSIRFSQWKETDPITMYTHVRSVEKFKTSLKFNYEPIFEGLWTLLGWLMLCVVAWVSFHFHSDAMSVKRSVKSFIFSALKVGFASALLAVVVGAGGEVCGSQDMFGCNDYSGEYRQPWSSGGMIEFFIKVYGAALFGLWLAYRGFAVSRKWY